MGVFHYKLVVVPRVYFGHRMPANLSEANIERGEGLASGWWAAHPPSEQLLAAIRAFLPTVKSWDETEEYVSTDVWGSDVRVWKDAGRIWRITFRFSPVADGWSLMQRFLALMRDEDCILFEEPSGTVIEPDEEIVRERLAASRAMHFVHDPDGTIIQAAKELKDDAG